jgi:hypothetical protein
MYFNLTGAWKIHKRRFISIEKAERLMKSINIAQAAQRHLPYSRFVQSLACQHTLNIVVILEHISAIAFLATVPTIPLPDRNLQPIKLPNDQVFGTRLKENSDSSWRAAFHHK